MHIQNYYQILEIDPFATQDEIKRAYLAKLKAYHPDKKNGHNSFAYKRFQMVLEAYEALKTPEKRHAYDELLKIQVSEIQKPRYTNLKSQNDNRAKKSVNIFGWLKKTKAQ